MNDEPRRDRANEKRFSGRPFSWTVTWKRGIVGCSVVEGTDTVVVVAVVVVVVVVVVEGGTRAVLVTAETTGVVENVSAGRVAITNGCI